LEETTSIHLKNKTKQKNTTFKGAVCKIVAKTGTAITFKLGCIPGPAFPHDSRLPDMLQDPAGM